MKINIRGVNVLQSWKGPGEFGPALRCVVIDCKSWVQMAMQISIRLLEETMATGYENRIISMLLHDPQNPEGTDMLEEEEEQELFKDQCTTDEEDTPEQQFRFVQGMADALQECAEHQKQAATLAALDDLLESTTSKGKRRQPPLDIARKPEPELPASMLLGLRLSSRISLDLRCKLHVKSVLSFEFKIYIYIYIFIYNT